MNIAHLTLSEYIDIIDEDHKSHSSQAYSTTVNALNRFKEKSPDQGGPEMSHLGTFMSNGLTFKIIEEKTDRRKGTYAKKDENGDILRDDRGLAVMMSEDEIVDLFPEDKRFRYEHAIVRVDTDEIVARTQDEWGCLLIYRAEEYAGFRLGTKLLDRHFDRHPDRPSGGMSPQGRECVYRVYQKRVSEALGRGEYRKLYQSGEMDMGKIREILNSANVSPSLIAEKNKELAKHGVSKEHQIKGYHETRKVPQTDLNMKKPEDWVAHIDNNFVIVYNKKLYDIEQDSLAWENFMEEGLIGYAYVGGVYNADSTPKLFREFALNDQVRGFMYESLLNEAVGEKIRIEPGELPFFKTLMGESLKSSSVPRSRAVDVWIDEPTMKGVPQLKFAEKILRREKDPYEEKFTLIHEATSAMAEEAHEKELANQKSEPELSF